ncbi:MAG: DUF4412 domain-containing protein [Balneolaceae bacterium]|nr:DUF4412 domain-containing protein [Balneolaceae bacterium]
MNIKKIFLSVLILLVSTFFSGAYAQFEGQIEMKTYSHDKGKTEPSTVNMYVTNNRILIRGEENFDFHNSMSAEGLLIRNDMKDFVVMVGEKKALQVTKAEIEELVGMFSSWGDNSHSSNGNRHKKPNYAYTSRTRTIMGYECTEMILNSEDGNSHLSVWLTPNIDINWGILAQPWKNLPKDFDEGINIMSQDVVFKGKNFPLLIEAVDEDGGRETVMEVVSLNESSIAKAMVQIPSNVSLVSAKEYIFDLMMNQ